MLYTLVICTWAGTLKEEEQLNNSSLCALYTIFLESLCKRANSTTGYFNDSNPSPVECFSSTRFIQPNIEHLDELAAAACKLLFSFEKATSIVFSDITLSNYISREEYAVCKAFALKAGILTNRKDKSRTGSSNSFIHKTMQEFLAAYFIARNTRVIDDIIDGYLKHCPSSYLDISQVFIFLCGMNIVAANKMSGLMNECDIAHCNGSFKYQQCEFQILILDGIKEAAASKQDGICPKLSHFNITDENIGDLHRIWSANTSNIQLLTVHSKHSFIRSFELPRLCSLSLSQPTTHFEFNLSSCYKLKQMRLSGKCILLKDGVGEELEENEKGDNVEGDDDEEEEVAGADEDDDDDDDDDDEEDVEDEEEDEGSNMQLLNQSVDLEDEDDYVDSTADGEEDDEEAGEEEEDDDDSAYLATSDFLISIVINKAEPAPCGDPSPVLPSIQYIGLDSITWSTSCLRSLFMTLLTLDHEVQCKLQQWCIISDVEGAVRESTGYTEYTVATIRTGFNHIFHIHCSAYGRLFWEAIHGLNIKWLRINRLEKGWIAGFVLFLHKSLQSLSQLETLNISVDAISRDLWEAVNSLSIKTVTLSQNGRWRGVIVNSVSKLSQVLISPTQMETIIIDVNAHPDLLEALCGRNIKRLCLYGRGENVEVNHVSALCKSLSSLKQLVTLDVMVKNDSPGLWKAFHGLNIKNLILSGGLRGVTMKHASAFSQLLASLTRLETLSIEVLKESQGLWETIRGMHITRLCLSWSDWERVVNHVEAMSKSISLLPQLETLSINAGFDRKELWQALNNLNIKSLSLSGSVRYMHLYNEDSLSQALSSLSQLDTLTLYVYEYKYLQLPQTLKYLNIYMKVLAFFEIRDLVNKLSACTQRVEIKLQFGVFHNDSKDLFIEKQEELKTLTNIKITRFLIYNWSPSIETGSDWCVQNVVVDIDGNDDDDNGDDELYKQFIDNVTALHRISMRFCIN